MSFQEWFKNGWIRQRPHETGAPEIANLLAVVERDLQTSADPKLNPDWRFAIAYNAALQCAALLLHASGFEVPKGGGAHYRTIESLPLTIGDDGTVVSQLRVFSKKRAGSVYEMTGVASETEIIQIRTLATKLRDQTLVWLRSKHPELLQSTTPPPPKPPKRAR